MNSKQNQGTMIMVGALAGAVGLVAFVALMALGGWAFSPAFFVALLLAIVVAIVLLMGFHSKAPEASEAPADDHAQAAVSPAAEPAPVAAAAPAPPAAPAPEPVAAPEPEPEAAPAPAPVADTISAEVPAAASTPSDSDKPKMLDAAREGSPDDLKQIKGVGPKLEKMLHGMGIFHFDQIAGWTERELAWVDQNLEGFKGRASRDAWVTQARTLASGGATEFSNRVKDGDVY